MNIVVRGHKVPVSEGLGEHCVARADRALQPFAGRVTRVEMVLVDVNGPRKGLGQECRLSVEVAGAARIFFRSRGRDYYEASSRAAHGAGKQLARLLERKRAEAHTRTPLLPSA